MNINLEIPLYSSDQFSWKNGRGTAEASDFGRGTRWVGARMFEDAADIGFYVYSKRTGVTSLFTYVFDEDGYDGELQVYENDQGHVITIFND